MTTSPTNDEVKALGKLTESMTRPQLDFLVKKVRQRYETLRIEQEMQVLEDAAPGKRVRFKSIKPKYLIGVTATILDILPEGKLRVEMINPPPRATRRFSPIVTVHASSCAVDRLMSTPYIECRALGHSWDSIPNVGRRPEFGVLMNYRCTRCTTVRRDLVNRFTGELLSRSYDKPRDYKMSGRPARAELRVEMLNRNRRSRSRPRQLKAR